MALTSKGHFKISYTKSGVGTEFKASEIKPSVESLSSEDSGRTDDGVLHNTFILGRIRKVSITMPPMKSEDLANNVLSMVQGREYYLTYFDMLDNAEKTIKCYTGNSSADCYSGVIYNGLWTGISFNAVQVGGEKLTNGTWREVGNE